MARAGQRAEQPTEHDIEAGLRFRRAERRSFRHLPDEKLEAWNDVEDDLRARTHGLQQRSTPYLNALGRPAE